MQTTYNANLIEAARAGQLSLLEQLLSDGANPVHQNARALVLACCLTDVTRRYACVAVLLRYGASDAVANGWPHNLAVDRGDLPLLNLLLSYPTLVKAHNSRSLRLAVLADQMPMVVALLDRGADINAVHQNMSIIEFAAQTNPTTFAFLFRLAFGAVQINACADYAHD